MDEEDGKLRALRLREAVASGASLTDTAWVFRQAKRLEGTEDRQCGVWATTVMRIRRGWGSIDPSLWEVDERLHDVAPEELLHAEIVAKDRRLPAYQRVRNAAECRRAIETPRVGVLAAFPLSDAWNAQNGEIGPARGQYDGQPLHAVAIVGHDKTRRAFVFVNNWGSNWGDEGRGYLPTGWLDSCLAEAWTIPPHLYQLQRRESAGLRGPRVVLDWDLPCPLGIVHGFEVYNREEDDVEGWTFACPRGAHLDVEEFFVRPRFRQCGVGRRLANGLRDLANRTSRRLRAWVPHVDYPPYVSDDRAVRWLAEELSLKLRSTSESWAAAVLE